MVTVTPRADESLVAALARRARGASDTRLALDAGAGLLIVGVALFWRPPGWIFLLGTGLVLGGFGTWGITDRELAERGDDAGALETDLLRFARGFAAVAAVAAALLLLFGLPSLALGNWIS